MREKKEFIFYQTLSNAHSKVVVHHYLPRTTSVGNERIWIWNWGFRNGFKETSPKQLVPHPQNARTLTNQESRNCRLKRVQTNLERFGGKVPLNCSSAKFSLLKWWSRVLKNGYLSLKRQVKNKGNRRRASLLTTSNPPRVLFTHKPFSSLKSLST